MSTLQREVYNVDLKSCSVWYGHLFTVRQRKAHTETYPISDDPLFQIGAEQLLSVTETALESPFLCVNRSLIRYGFRAVAEAIYNYIPTH